MSGFLNTTDEEDTVTKSELLEVRNGTRQIVNCEECQHPYARKRRDQRFCSSKCAGLFNAKVAYGPTGKPPRVAADDQAVVDALWLEPLAKPMQPFTDEEIEHVAALTGLDPIKVRGIAWLTTLKLRLSA